MAGLALLLLGLHGAQACDACASGDPTIMVMGAERPRAGGLRLSSEIRYRYERSLDAREQPWYADELRLALGVAWAPSDRWILATALPLATAAVRGPDLSEARGLGIGDAEVRVRWVALRDRTRSPTHLGGLTGGLDLPTAVRVRHHGQPAPEDAQLGLGAWTPSLGLWYGYFGGSAWSFFTSLTGRVSTTGWASRRPGPAVLGTTAVQWQPHPNVGARLTLDGRWSAQERVAAVPDPDTGGWLLQAAPGLVLRPGAGVILLASVGLPFAQGLGGTSREGVVPSLGVIVEL